MEKIERLGNNRCLWLRASNAPNTLALGVVYLPSGSDRVSVNEWVKHLKNLVRDINLIKTVFEWPFTLSGDFDVQPTASKESSSC